MAGSHQRSHEEYESDGEQSRTGVARGPQLPDEVVVDHTRRTKLAGKKDVCSRGADVTDASEAGNAHMRNLRLMQVSEEMRICAICV